MSRFALLLIFSGAWAAAAQGQFPPERTPPTAQPAHREKKPGEFQPGVIIDWAAKSVRVNARVVLREGPIEYFACRPGKEHESILLLEASAMHIYMALGLVGLTPGSPPTWDETANRYKPPSGDLIDVSMDWKQDGQSRRAGAFDWLLDAEYARPPLARPMIFAGSRRTRGDSLAAEHTGGVIAIVDAGDSLLCLTRSHGDLNAELWALANTPVIPPLDTPVTLVFKAAAPLNHDWRLDFRGDFYAGERYVTPADAADLIGLTGRLRPDAAVKVRVDGALRSDIERAASKLAKLGIEKDAVQFVQAASQPASRPSQPASSRASGPPGDPTERRR